MPRSDGPRLVVELDRDLKRRFHSRIALDGTTVKDWVTVRIESYLGTQQLPLSLGENAAPAPGAMMLGETPATYGADAAPATRPRKKKVGSTVQRKRNRASKTPRSNDS
jgi:hypothetical protein